MVKELLGGRWKDKCSSKIATVWMNRWANNIRRQWKRRLKEAVRGHEILVS